MHVNFRSKLGVACHIPNTFSIFRIRDLNTNCFPFRISEWSPMAINPMPLYVISIKEKPDLKSRFKFIPKGFAFPTR